MLKELIYLYLVFGISLNDLNIVKNILKWDGYDGINIDKQDKIAMNECMNGNVEWMDETMMLPIHEKSTLNKKNS